MSNYINLLNDLQKMTNSIAGIINEYNKQSISLSEDIKSFAIKINHKKKEVKDDDDIEIIDDQDYINTNKNIKTKKIKKNKNIEYVEID